MPILLKKDYVDSVLKTFHIAQENVKSFTPKCDFCEKFCICWGNSQCKNYFINYLNGNIQNYLNSKITTKLIYKYGNSKFSYCINIYPHMEDGTVVLPEILKSESSIEQNKTPAFKDYILINVPADGNCAFISVKIAMNDDEFKDKIGKKLTREQTDAIITLREATADKMKKVIINSDDFIEMLRQPGFWNNGIDGAVGIEVLSFMAEALEEPILVLTQEPNGQYRYWLSGTKENPHDGNLIFNNITIENFTQMSIEEKIEEILNAHPNAIKLFHNGIHFQAIVKKPENA